MVFQTYIKWIRKSYSPLDVYIWSNTGSFWGFNPNLNCRKEAMIHLICSKIWKKGLRVTNGKSYWRTEQFKWFCLLIHCVWVRCILVWNGVTQLQHTPIKWPHAVITSLSPNSSRLFSSQLMNCVRCQQTKRATTILRTTNRHSVWSCSARL